MNEQRAIGEVSRVAQMPYGLARTQAAERLVRRIEADGPEQVLPYALATLTESMFWAGEPERSFVPFTRMVRLWDTRPEHFDAHDRHALFWMFKWMVADLMEFPQVPAAQIEATIEDMARRYAVEGLGPNAVAHQRFLWADARGDAAESDAAFAAWCATPRDEFAQCEACEPGDRASYLHARGRHEEAVRLVEAALAENARCATEPASMLAVVQLAYLALGRDDDAARAFHRTVAELGRAKGEMAHARGRVVEFLARSGNDDAALRRIATEQRLLAACETPRARLDLLVCVGTATHLASAAGRGDATVEVSVPGLTPAGGAPTVAELDTWVRAQAQALAAAFDRRNGTSAASARVAAAWTATRPDRVVDLAVVRAADLERPAPGPAAGTAVTPADSATADATEQDEEATLAEAAEQAERDGAWDRAADLHLSTSRLAQAAGRLGDAGWAVARAARCAWRAADLAGATAGYARALAMLDAAGTPPGDLVAVFTDHGACAAEAGEPARVLPAVDAHAAALATALEAEDLPDVEPHLARRDRDARRRAHLRLADLRARLLAEAGALEEAAALAEDAAVALAEAGATGDAAHAFWLCGRLRRDLGDLDAAAWHLESAVEGLALAADGSGRADAAGELIAVLRAAGRTAEADAVEL